jgi:hypothetical protein
VPVPVETTAQPLALAKVIEVLHLGFTQFSYVHTELDLCKAVSFNLRKDLFIFRLPRCLAWFKLHKRQNESARQIDTRLHGATRWQAQAHVTGCHCPAAGCRSPERPSAPRRRRAPPPGRPGGTSTTQAPGKRNSSSNPGQTTEEPRTLIGGTSTIQA